MNSEANASEEARSFRVAVVQMDPRLGDRNVNRGVMMEKIAEAAQAGARLVVFPECALSGYVYEAASEALPAAETVAVAATRARRSIRARSLLGPGSMAGRAHVRAGPTGRGGAVRRTGDRLSDRRDDVDTFWLERRRRSSWQSRRLAFWRGSRCRCMNPSRSSCFGTCSAR